MVVGVGVRFLALVLAASACDSASGALVLTAVAPPSAFVAHEVVVPLLADGAEGQRVEWSWQSASHPGLSSRSRRPSLSVYTAGRALWRFTPLASDVGAVALSFTAQSGLRKGSLEIELFIDPGGDPPLFREPVGEGTALDLKIAPCANVAVVVESSGTPQVLISLRDPPANAELTQDGLSGTLRFCPSREQAASETVYPLLFVAEAANHVVHKSYVIVLRRNT